MLLSYFLLQVAGPYVVGLVAPVYVLFGALVNFHGHVVLHLVNHGVTPKLVSHQVSHVHVLVLVVSVYPMHRLVIQRIGSTIALFDLAWLGLTPSNAGAGLEVLGAHSFCSDF